MVSCRPHRALPNGARKSAVHYTGLGRQSMQLGFGGVSVGGGLRIEGQNGTCGLHGC